MQIFASLRTRAKVEKEILSSSSECLVGNSSGVFSLIEILWVSKLCLMILKISSKIPIYGLLPDIVFTDWLRNN